MTLCDSEHKKISTNNEQMMECWMQKQDKEEYIHKTWTQIKKFWTWKIL